MIGKVKLAWKAWRGSRAIRKEISKMNGKPWWKSTQVWGSIVKTGCGILTAMGVVTISQEQAAQVADQIGVAIGALGTIAGQVFEIWGKRKHAERVAAAK